MPGLTADPLPRLSMAEVFYTVHSPTTLQIRIAFTLMLFSNFNVE